MFSTVIYRRGQADSLIFQAFLATGEEIVG